MLLVIGGSFVGGWPIFTFWGVVWLLSCLVTGSRSFERRGNVVVWARRVGRFTVRLRRWRCRMMTVD